MSWFGKKPRTERVLEYFVNVQRNLGRELDKLGIWPDIDPVEFGYFCYYVAVSGSAAGGGEFSATERLEMEPKIVFLAMMKNQNVDSVSKLEEDPNFKETLKVFKSKFDQSYSEYYEAALLRPGYEPHEELTKRFIARSLRSHPGLEDQKDLLSPLRKEIISCTLAASRIR